MRSVVGCAGMLLCAVACGQVVESSADGAAPSLDEAARTPPSEGPPQSWGPDFGIDVTKVSCTLERSTPACPPPLYGPEIERQLSANGGDPLAIRELHEWNDLSGVECLSNLEVLMVDQATTDQLVPLMHLPRLRALEVWTLEGTLEPLACLSTLSSLRLMGVVAGDRLSLDIRPIAALSELEELFLAGYTPFQTLAPLGLLTKLRKFGVFDVTVERGAPDYSFVASLRLEELDLTFAHATIDLALLDTARLRSVSLTGTPADNFHELGAPAGPPGELVFQHGFPADAATDPELEEAAKAPCARGWCAFQLVGDPEAFEATRVPLCDSGCGLEAQ